MFDGDTSLPEALLIDKGGVEQGVVRDNAHAQLETMLAQENGCVDNNLRHNLSAAHAVKF
jgi:hypothetical protein